MKMGLSNFLNEHDAVTRRFFLRCGAAGIAAASAMPVFAEEVDRAPELQKVLKELETWLTRQDDFRDVSRGKPKPHSLPMEKMKEVGLTRDTWSLEVVSDTEHKAKLDNPLTKETKNALDFAGLMKLAETRAVRFPKVMTCLNIGCPLGNGIWEGVPLRDVVWMTKPKENLRRVFYYGYHNDDPGQMFRSSLPIGRVLEDPFDLPPVILCYKLNGAWLTPERGGPVRIVFPEGYGFKNVKWLTHVVLSNISHANDTYAGGNNDVDSPLKTFCATLSFSRRPTSDQPIPITGYAQVGISGLKKVQVWIQNNNDKLPDDDPYHTRAPWKDAEILPPPAAWGGDIADNQIPSPTHNFDPKTGQPTTWPIRLAKAHWAVLHPGLPAGEYTLRCRTIDEKGNAQPLPRPFPKSGRTAIEKKRIVVKSAT